MGVDIRALKVLRKSDNEEESDHIYNVGFPPVNHLTAFDEGYYETVNGKYSFSCSYSFYGSIRRAICNMANNCDPEELWNNPEEYIDAPFFEMINFSDCEGNFDYIIAEKLYKDFLKYDEKAKDIFGDRYYYYEDYKNILKECINFKGVVHYW